MYNSVDQHTLNDGHGGCGAKGKSFGPEGSLFSPLDCKDRLGKTRVNKHFASLIKATVVPLIKALNPQKLSQRSCLVAFRLDCGCTEPLPGVNVIQMLLTKRSSHGAFSEEIKVK